MLAQRLKRRFRLIKEIVAGDAPRVELFYWSPGNGRENFGDFIGKELSEAILNTKFLSFASETIRRHEVWSRPVQLLTVGSILHFAFDNAVIWGSGVNGKIREEEYHFSKLDVRMVRGPMTRDFLLEMGTECPEVYGDPGLLLPHFHPITIDAHQSLPYVFIPNLNDYDHYAGAEFVVDPTLPWRSVVEQIVRADFVMATSLHGLVIAEAYGVPARCIVSQNEHPFKYRDYYAGTGRSTCTFATSIAEALEMGGESPPCYDVQSMLDAFPFDIWDD